MISNQKQKTILFLIIYLIMVFILTQSPFAFSAFWLNHLLSFNKLEFLKYIFYISGHDIINNIILFLPLGIILHHLFLRKTFTGIQRFWMSLLWGGALSICIEAGQLFLDRSATLFDIVSNACGTYLGLWLTGKWPALKPHFIMKSVIQHIRRWLYIAISIYIIVFFILVFVPPVMNDLNVWEDDFHLLVGNEEGSERPWKGEIALVAIYNKALDGSGIRSLFRLKHCEVDTLERQKYGLVSYYPFSKNRGDTIYDIVSRDGSSHLWGDSVSWLGGHTGIRIEKGHPLKSLARVKKLTNGLKQTSQFSVEVWIRTEHLDQKGPARIVTLSGGTEIRNFTLGQYHKQIHLRVRTLQAGPNGSFISLRAKEIITDDSWHHIVVTFHRGCERLAIDGRFSDDMVRADIDYLPNLLGFGTNKISRISFYFIMLFPLTCLVFELVRRYRIFITIITISCIIAAIEILYLVLLGQPFGWTFFGMGASIAFLGCMAMKIWKK